MKKKGAKNTRKQAPKFEHKFICDQHQDAGALDFEDFKTHLANVHQVKLLKTYGSRKQ
jgi:hypothetical protein